MRQCKNAGAPLRKLMGVTGEQQALLPGAAAVLSNEKSLAHAPAQSSDLILCIELADFGDSSAH